MSAGRAHRDVDALSVQVEKIWREILKMPKGVENATFFDLQGQSVSAVRIVSRIESELGINVDITSLFDDPDMRTFIREVIAESGTQPTSRH